MTCRNTRSSTTIPSHIRPSQPPIDLEPGPNEIVIGEVQSPEDDRYEIRYKDQSTGLTRWVRIQNEFRSNLRELRTSTVRLKPEGGTHTAFVESTLPPATTQRSSIVKDPLLQPLPGETLKEASWSITSQHSPRQDEVLYWNESTGARRLLKMTTDYNARSRTLRTRYSEPPHTNPQIDVRHLELRRNNA